MTILTSPEEETVDINNLKYNPIIFDPFQLLFHDVSPPFTLLFSHFFLLKANCQNETVLDDEII